VAMGGAMAIIGATAILAPFAIIQPAYAPPIVSGLPGDATQISTRFGDVELIGYRLGADQVQTGESIALDTYWRRAQLADPSDQRSLHAVAVLSMIESGTSLGRSEGVLGTDAYPSWAWQPNEIVETRLKLTTTAAASAVGALQLGVRGDTAQLIPSAAGETIGLGRVIVRTVTTCDRPVKVDVTYGGSLKLAGYRIEQSTVVGVPARVVLCWESLKPTNVDYTVFVHVTDARGDAFTSDAQPRGGTYPTSAWATGERIEDGHPLPAVIDLVIKRVSVGLYRLDTGERLAIDGTNNTEFVIADF
jgi:hypothetical protein